MWARGLPDGRGTAIPIVLTGCLFAVLGACTGLGGGGGDISCTPPPQINSSPPTQATVGQQYVYDVDAAYLCGMWSICNNIVGVQLPAGATIDDFYDAIIWTPTDEHANQDVGFVIATEQDDCGDAARQSWTVHVSPAAGAAARTADDNLGR